MAPSTSGASGSRRWRRSLRDRCRAGACWVNSAVRRWSGVTRHQGCPHPCPPDSGCVTRAGAASISRRPSSCRRGIVREVFEPLELLERLTALTPRPRINLLLYYGVLGARSAWRSRLKVPDSAQVEAPLQTRDTSSAVAGGARPGRNRLWADQMRRSFGFDVLSCPRCGDRLELIALIEDPRVIRRILTHLGLPSEVPTPRLARSPPLPLASSERPFEDGIDVP
jgi:hypothetical protein